MFSLIDYVTPIQVSSFKLPYGNQLLIKREDLLPFSFGGNKVRIAECFYNDMVIKNKNLMIGYGSNTSNLCRVLSNLCISRNKDIWIITPDEEPESKRDSINSVFLSMFNAHIIRCKKRNVAQTIDDVLIDAQKKGYSPYYINGNCFGVGNESTPVFAYRKVFQQITEQISEQRDLCADYYFLATGTGMTYAGLLVGKILSDDKIHNPTIVGISIAREKEKVKEHIRRYIDSFLLLMGKKIEYDSLINILEYSCGGYGQYTSEIETIINRELRYDGIAFDPIYTGKAFCGMLEYLEKNKIRNKKILFIHTGSNPLYFDYMKGML